MNLNNLLTPIRQLHAQIRAAVVATCETASLEAMARIAHDEVGDTIYAIDKVSEALLIDFFEREIAIHTPIVLIAEGLTDFDNSAALIAGKVSQREVGEIVLPRGTPEHQAKWRIIVDPIDGTRGLMYQKRSAWILTGVAPNKGPQTTLRDIELAVQTEIPLVKQHLSDGLWAIAGQGVQAERFNRLTGEAQPLTVQPSQARSIAHGFAMISRFFPGARAELAAIDEEIVQRALGPVQPGKAHCFEDQYICSGGQLYELMVGHDRFNADLRPLMEQVLAERGLSLGICCHPYDLCTELIARELGLILTTPNGQPLTAPLNLHANVSWVGYANRHIQAQIEPLLQDALRQRGLL